MRRFSTIILSILLGAVAVAVGMGVFLHLANTDRERLAEIARKAQQDSKIALDAREAAVQEANAKLATAESAVQKTQTELQALQEERRLLVSAQLLPTPSPRELKQWKEAIKLPLGVGVKIPPQSAADLGNDWDQVPKISVVIMDKTTTSTIPTDEHRWLTILPYDEQTELNQLQALSASSTDINYLVDGHVIVGKLGKNALTQGETLVAHIQSSGERKFFLSAKTIPGRVTLQTILSTIATLNFSK